MNRRSFLSAATAGAALAAQQVDAQVADRIEAPSRFVNRKMGLHPFSFRDPGQRPHIFVITLDMVSADHYHPSRAMHRELRLTALRSLFADSTFFTNAFCTSPLCAPARAALATGRYTYITANGERAHDGHETILRPADVIFQEYLKATGYVTKHAGKGHLGTQKYMDAFDENDNAWDRWAPPIYDDEAYLAWLRQLGVKRQRYKQEITGLQQDRKSPGASFGGWIEQENGQTFPMEAQYTHYLVRKAIDKLDAALQEKGKPVYLQLDIFDPHQPFSVPAGFEQRRNSFREIQTPPASYERAREANFGPLPGEPKVYGFYRKNWGLYDPKTVRDYRIANALQMEVVDAALFQFLNALKQRGLYEESMIVFTSDHGEMNGRRAMVDKGVYLFPEVLRVPFAIKMPKSANVKPRVVDNPVSHLDIAPTLLALAGVQPAERLDGRSLLPFLRSGAALEAKDVLFECGWHVGVNFACGMQRRLADGKHYLYAYNLSSDVDELYDLSDPDPVNLAQDPAHREARREMIRHLGAFLQNDPRWIGYWHSLRIDHYEELPRQQSGDMQMFRPI